MAMAFTNYNMTIEKSSKLTKEKKVEYALIDILK
jgi:hypothetical protein